MCWSFSKKGKSLWFTSKGRLQYGHESSIGAGGAALCGRTESACELELYSTTWCESERMGRQSGWSKLSTALSSCETITKAPSGVGDEPVMLKLSSKYWVDIGPGRLCCNVESVPGCFA